MSNRPRRLLAAFVAVCIVLGALGCSGNAPVGPAFERAATPATHRARLYVYRADPRASLSRIRLEFDGREVGALGNREYETIEVAPGPHRLRAGLRGAAFLAWGWNEQPIRLTPGETVYVRLTVRLSDHAAPQTGRAVDIAGRTSGVASENVFIERVGEARALEELADTTRRVP